MLLKEQTILNKNGLGKKSKTGTRFCDNYFAHWTINMFCMQTGKLILSHSRICGLADRRNSMVLDSFKLVSSLYLALEPQFFPRLNYGVGGLVQ